MPDIKNKVKILFICTGNSCRSQMAEGWARHLFEEFVEVFSAGTENLRLNPRAVLVMAEAGVDISYHVSKAISELPETEFDFVITVCSAADANCPVFPGNARKIHHGFDDPPALAAGARSEEEAIQHYRRVRDEIRQFVESLRDSIITVYQERTYSKNNESISGGNADGFEDGRG